MEIQEQTPAPAEPTDVQEAPKPEAPEPVEPKAEAPKKPSTIEESLSKAFKADLTEKPKEEPKPDAEPAAEITKEEPQDSERPRGPDGKFVAKDADKPAEATEKAEKPAPEADEGTEYQDAPTRFSADAKAAWKDAPKAVRAEAHRMMKELEGGLAQKDEIIEPLKPFMEMAQKHNTTVHQALANYTRIDGMLRQDPRAGYAHLARSMGHTPEQVAALLTGQEPGQPDAKDREIADLRRELNETRQQVQQVSTNFQTQQEQAIAQQVNQFAAQNPRFEELQDDIVQMLSTGYATSLEDAYQKAERLNPAPPQPEPVPAPPPVAQTREAKSVTGAPSTGSNPVKRTPSKSPEEALKRAFNL